MLSLKTAISNGKLKPVTKESLTTLPSRSYFPIVFAKAFVNVDLAHDGCGLAPERHRSDGDVEKDAEQARQRGRVGSAVCFHRYRGMGCPSSPGLVFIVGVLKRTMERPGGNSRARFSLYAKDQAMKNSKL